MCQHHIIQCGIGFRFFGVEIKIGLIDLAFEVATHQQIRKDIILFVIGKSPKLVIDNSEGEVTLYPTATFICHLNIQFYRISDLIKGAMRFYVYFQLAVFIDKNQTLGMWNFLGIEYRHLGDTDREAICRYFYQVFAYLGFQAHLKN